MKLPLPATNGCYFCDLIADPAAWNVIAQDPLIVTLLNARQFELGQCLIVPRRHAATLLDLDDRECAEVMRGARRVARVMVELFAPDGVLVYQNNGTGAGQEVPHFHLHVVPRRTGGAFGAGPPRLAEIERGLRALHDNLKMTPEKSAAAAALRNGLERD